VAVVAAVTLSTDTDDVADLYVRDLGSDSNGDTGDLVTDNLRVVRGTPSTARSVQIGTALCENKSTPINWLFTSALAALQKLTTPQYMILTERQSVRIRIPFFAMRIASRSAHYRHRSPPKAWARTRTS